jgi:hypothetical protein
LTYHQIQGRGFPQEFGKGKVHLPEWTMALKLGSIAVFPAEEAIWQPKEGRDILVLQKGAQ